MERRHRSVVETDLSLLAQSGVPLYFWDYAFNTAVYLLNRLPTQRTGTSPYEIIYQQPPSYLFLKSFGCLCFPLLRPYTHHKLALRSTPCIFLGYSQHHHGYICLDYNSNKQYIVRHCRFIESTFPLKSTVSSSPNHPPTPTVDTTP